MKFDQNVEYRRTAGAYRAVARILFQPRQRGEPGSGGGAPSGVQGQRPWLEGQGASPPEAESFSVLGCPKETEELYFFIYGLYIIQQKLS